MSTYKLRFKNIMDPFDRDNDGDVDPNEIPKEDAKLQQADDVNLNFESAFFGAIISKIAYYDDYMFMIMLQWTFSNDLFTDYLNNLKEETFENKFENRKTYINLARELNEKIDKIYNKKVPNIVNNDTIQWKNSRINDYNLKKFELIGLSTSKTTFYNHKNFIGYVCLYYI